MGLVPADRRRASRFDGQAHRSASPRGALQAVRRQMQYVFQDPYSSLNPVLTAGEIVAEPLRIHGLYDEMGGRARIARLFEMVGPLAARAWAAIRASSRAGRSSASASPARSRSSRACSSSTSRWRRSTSRSRRRSSTCCRTCSANSASPICSSRTTSRWCATSRDRVAVMYLGRIVEESDQDDALRRRPLHPYTQSLLSAVPVPDPGRAQRRAAHRARRARSRTRPRRRPAAPSIRAASAADRALRRRWCRRSRAGAGAAPARAACHYRRARSLRRANRAIRGRAAWERGA